MKVAVISNSSLRCLKMLKNLLKYNRLCASASGEANQESQVWLTGLGKKDILEAIDCLLPKNEKQTNKLKTLKLFYDRHWSDCEIQAEHMLWNTKWKNGEESGIPKKIMSVLYASDKNFYPAINYLLQVTSYFNKNKYTNTSTFW